MGNSNHKNISKCFKWVTEPFKWGQKTMNICIESAFLELSLSGKINTERLKTECIHTEWHYATKKIL